MTRVRVRGAHRHPRFGTAAGAAAAGGPRRLVVSLGALAVVAAIGGVGAVVVRGGGPDRTPVAAPHTSAAATPTPWTVESPSVEGFTPTAAATGVPAASSTSIPGVPLSPAGTSGAASPAATAGATTAAGPAVAATDRAAGVLSAVAPPAGERALVVVPGSVPAPNGAPRERVRVEVEDGIGAAGPAFASFVLDTLNDPRGWGHGGTLTFARTDGPADLRVVLAGPQTAARLCGALRARTVTSCAGGGLVVLGMDGWRDGLPDYRGDRTTYRQYLVNHEVGRALGHAFGFCTPGHLAPVMLDETDGLHGCLPNAWPFP